MGDTKISNTTGYLDLLLGVRTAEADGIKGTGYGAGNNQDEANKSAYEHYQRADPNDSHYVPKR